MVKSFCSIYGKIKNMKSTKIMIIIVLILIFSVVYIINNKKTNDLAIIPDRQSVISTEDSGVMSGTSEGKPKLVADGLIDIKSGKYENYTVEKLSNADSGDVVLFFKASWCPSCRTVDADIKTNINNIPETLTILELDYDKATDLKKKYGVTTQHTFVQVDKDGTMIKKWSGGSTLNSLIQEVI